MFGACDAYCKFSYGSNEADTPKTEVVRFLSPPNLKSEP